MNDALNIFHPEHRSPFNIFSYQRQIDPAHTAGSRKRPFRIAVHSWNLCLLAVQQIFSHSKYSITNSVEMAGFEPATFALQRRCSPTELHPQNLLGLVGLTGFEPVTPVLSGLCSNRLSYKPV